MDEEAALCRSSLVWGALLVAMVIVLKLCSATTGGTMGMMFRYDVLGSINVLISEVAIDKQGTGWV